MDFHHKEILKRYAKMATGRPFAPILLNILITSVCDMRCVHCFFTEELDDKPRKFELARARETGDSALFFPGKVLADAPPSELTTLMSLPNLESVFAQLVQQQDTRSIAQEIVAVMQLDHA